MLAGTMPTRPRLAAPAAVDPAADDWDEKLIELPAPLERRFELVAPFKAAGGQPAAIEQLINGLQQGEANQVLLGITGSGKTFTVANVIREAGCARR